MLQGFTTVLESYTEQKTWTLCMVILTALFLTVSNTYLTIKQQNSRGGGATSRRKQPQFVLVTPFNQNLYRYDMMTDSKPFVCLLRSSGAVRAGNGPSLISCQGRLCFILKAKPGKKTSDSSPTLKLAGRITLLW